MMAAGRAAELGARVILIEKNKNLGKKLLITGNGRCNLTQAEFDDKKLVDALGKKGQFFFSALSAFGPRETMKFFEKRNLLLKIEQDRRVFPVSDRATDVLETLRNYLAEHKVNVLLGREILGFNLKNAEIESVESSAGTIRANKFILCAGGKAYPATGSTGQGYEWVKKMGHNIIQPEPALVPVVLMESWIKDLQGLSLKNVRIDVFQEGKKAADRFGEVLFTHFGISGPIILDISRKVGELLKNGKVEIVLDLEPALDAGQLDVRLRNDFASNINKNFKNYLSNLLPRKLTQTIIKLSGIKGDKKINEVSREERKKLVSILKSLRMSVAGLQGFDQAIVTAGGIDLKEVDSKTMRSKIVKNLFFAGEILDLDGPTGGYNLQICWSTGFAAGTAAGGE